MRHKRGFIPGIAPTGNPSSPEGEFSEFLQDDSGTTRNYYDCTGSQVKMTFCSLEMINNDDFNCTRYSLIQRSV